MDIATGLEATGPVDAARTFEEYIRNIYTLVDEPEEILVDPSVQLTELENSGRIRGDCDDAAMLLACFLYIIGLETRFKAVGSNPDGSYQHVFVEYRMRGLNRWIPVDPTIEGIPVYDPGDYITEVV